MIVLRDNKIYLYEAAILVLLWPIYLIISICFFGADKETEFESLLPESILKNDDTSFKSLKEVNYIIEFLK